MVDSLFVVMKCNVLILACAGLNTTDPNEERDPPPSPTVIRFPSPQAYPSGDGKDWTNTTDRPNFQDIFRKVLKPADVTHEHISTLNLEVLPASAPGDLLPTKRDGTSYLLSLEPLKEVDPYGMTYAESIGTNPVTARRRRDFDERLVELNVDNDTAFRVLNRTTVKGTKPPRLAYMRKFFQGLESMSLYWDCSLDQFYEVSDTVDDERDGPKRQRLDSDSTANSPIIKSSIFKPGDVQAHHSRPQTSVEGKSRISLPLDSVVRVQDEQATAVNSTADVQGPDQRDTQAPEAPPQATSRMRYKGRRTSTGRAMPDSFRTETVRGFVEGIVWPFQCTIAAPRQMPVVKVGKLNVPVRQTASVYRMPSDRIRARQGQVEGPMMFLQVRSDTEFPPPPDIRSRLDFMREVGGLLQLAQERRREGRQQLKPGQGQWWTEKPRWGGGPGGEVENQAGNSDVVGAVEELLDGAKVHRGKDGGKGRKKKTPALLWKELKCGSGNWDPKTDYTAIGKPDSEYDEVFLISSLNHHISILKLTVHGAYTDYIESGTPPEPVPSDKAWCRPRLERTLWFDLFDVEQRKAMFQALWAVMSYLTREAPTSTQSSQEVKMGNA